ncbi:CDI toxin immunity protein (plasmid) [Peribacillus sp. JNUCC 23]
MNKEERQKRLSELLTARKQKEIFQQKMKKEKEVKDLFEEVFDNLLEIEILDTNKSDLIVENFSGTFPIAFWNRIDWDKGNVNKLELNIQDIKNIPLMLHSKGFDTTTPIYAFWGYDDYPCVKTSLTTQMLSKIDDIIWLGIDLYIYCPTQRFVIEFFHDDSVNIGWI